MKNPNERVAKFFTLSSVLKAFSLLFKKRSRKKMAAWRMK